MCYLLLFLWWCWSCDGHHIGNTLATGISVVLGGCGGGVGIKCGFCVGADGGIGVEAPHTNGVMSSLVIICAGVVFRWHGGNAINGTGALVHG